MRTTCLLLLLSLIQLYGWSNHPAVAPLKPEGLVAIRGPLQTATLSSTSQRPTAPSVQPIRIKKGTFISFPLPVFTSPEGIQILYSVNEVTLPPGMMFNVLTRSLAGTPTKAGHYQISYFGRHYNQSLSEYTKTKFSVIVEDRIPPVAPEIPSRVVKQGQAFSFQLPAFSSPDGSTVTYDLDCDCETSSGFPSWLHFDVHTRTLSGTTPNFARNYKMFYSGRDQAHSMTSDTEFEFIIAPNPNDVDRPPTAPSIQPIQIKKGEFVSVKLPAFTDPDGNLIQYSVNEGNLPPGMMFNVLTRSIAGTPTTPGRYQISYFGYNQHKYLYTKTEFSLIVADRIPPIAPPVSSLLVKQGQTFSFQLPAFTSPEGSPMTYDLDCGCSSYFDLPSWMNFDATTRTLSGTAPTYIESLKLMYTGRDQAHSIGTDTEFEFIVAPNTAPTAPAVADKTLEYGDAYTVTLPEFTDPDGDPIQNLRLRCNDCQGHSGNLPSWMHFDASTRKLTVSAQEYGGYILYYLADDNQGHTGITPVRLTVREYKKPAVPTVPNLTVKINEPFDIQLPPFVDADNREVKALKLNCTDCPGQSAIELKLPVWMNFDPQTRRITGTAPVLGTFRFNYVALYGFQKSLLLPVNLSISNVSNVLPVNPGNVANFDGYLNKVECGTIRGWAWDRTQPNSPVTVEILADDAVVGSVSADLYGQDLKDAGKGNGYHAYSFTVPQNLKDGATRVIKARIKDTAFFLKDGPKFLACSDNSVTAPTVSPLTTTIGVPYSTTLPVFINPQNQPLTYSLTGLPDGLTFDGGNRKISGTPTATGNFVLTYAAKNNQNVTTSTTTAITVNAPTVNGSNFDGYLDKVECGTIRGWVWERNQPNTPYTVEFLADGQVIGTALANIYRDDLKTAGKGNGAHAYSFTVPQSLKDGQAHSISARVLNTNYTLKGAPKNLTCYNTLRQAAGPNIYYVTETGAGTKDGRSWENAYDHTQLQLAIDEGYQSGSAEVWVAQGVYKPVFPRTSFFLSDNVTIYGGFPVGGGTMAQRNPLLNPTILSGEAGLPGDPSDNLKHVIFTMNAPASAVLDGFVITGGNASDGNPAGGGIVIDGGSPTIRNCRFVENTGAVGAAIAIFNGSPTIINCVFSGNSASTIGGAISNNAGDGKTSTPLIVNCTFYDNAAPSGRTIYNYGPGQATPELTNCIIWNSGGSNSVRSEPGKTVNIQYSLLEEGTTYSDGGHNLINQVPQFANAATGDLRLLPCSPAINAGLNTANPLATDQAGQNRVQQHTIDLGAFENVAPLTPDLYNGQSSVSIVQGTPNVVLTAANCAGELSWVRTNPLMAGTGPITVPTDVLATYIYTAVCKVGSCPSLPASLTVTIVPPGQEPEAPVVTGHFEGYLDKVECGTIRGWVWDISQPNTPLAVEFFANGQSIGSTPANLYRQDLKDAGKGNGLHAYSFPTPESLKNGQNYSITAKVQHSSYALKWGPKTLQCANANPDPNPNPDPDPGQSPISGKFEGFLDKVECGSLRGWVWDASQPTMPLSVEFFADGQSLGTSVADLFQQDLLDAGKGNGKHAYFFPKPNQLKDGQPHQISAKVANSNYTLKWAPKTLTCYNNLRLATPSAEETQPWKAVVLGNPVTGDAIDLEIQDAQGQLLRLQLTNASGQEISNQWLEVKQERQQVQLKFTNQAPGLYLLRIAGTQQAQTLKVLKR